MRGSILIVLCLAVFSVDCKEEAIKHGNPIHDKHYEDGHDEKYDHEAILGSDDEIEEYSQLSPEEIKKKLSTLIPLMDTNSDGGVDSDELTQWILKSFQKLNLEDTREKMKTDDKNGDGFVTWEEFMDSTYGMTEDELEDYRNNDQDDPESKAQITKSLDYDKNKFKAADENNDGKLSVEEATAFMHPYDYERMSDVESNRVMVDYDMDGDGMISVEEYVGNKVFAKKPKEELEGERENFRFHDLDKDGKLNKEELLKWVSPDLERIAREEAAHLTGETDADKDGLLTPEEILEEYELWVGSGAIEDDDDTEHDEL